MAGCERCRVEFQEEDPAYEVHFGFVFPRTLDGIPVLHFEQDSLTGIFHGRCIGLPERNNEDCLTDDALSGTVSAG